MYFRKIYARQKELLASDRAVFILGPRQVGKTTFLRRLFDTCSEGARAWVNLENPEYAGIFTSPSSVLDFVGRNRSGKGIFHLFLDEFQRVPDIGRTIKSLYDDYPWLRVVASGSNNVEINQRIRESLAGRKKIVKMFPLDWDEFLAWRMGGGDVPDLATWAVKYHQGLNTVRIEAAMREYLQWGGYPKVVLAAGDVAKKEELDSIFDFWFNRDVAVETKKVYEFRRFVQQMAFHHGGIVNFSQIGALCGVTAPTVDRFVGMLEETFMGVRVRPFFTNKLKEVTKSPKFYFLDPGFRNWLAGRFVLSDQDYGALFEGFYLAERIKAGFDPLDARFWRTADARHEVDFVFEKERLAVELKWGNHAHTAGMMQFTKAYPDWEVKVLERMDYVR